MNRFVNSCWKLVSKFLPLLDFILIPFTFLSAVWFLAIRKGGVERSNFSKKIFLSVGVFPIRDHYYEPLFNASYIKRRGNDRHLPGIDLNVETQLSLLDEFRFSDELKLIPFTKQAGNAYYFDNPSFRAGDADFLYNMIRLKKPRNIIEIGSGYSTLMALQALRKNEHEDSSYTCNFICIEPYEMPWLEKTGVQVIRKKVQEMDYSLFKSLGPNDILFIDSSHVIRPDGDVLFEYLEVLPILKKGVLIHIHDIYTPRDYPFENYEKYVVFINEQYLVEAFLTLNRDFRIIGAVNFLKHNFPKNLLGKCPALEVQRDFEPRSLWIERL